MIIPQPEDALPIEIDPFLLKLSRMANGYNLPTPVTLICGGVVVSGHTISEIKYFAKIGEQMAQASTFVGDDGQPLNSYHFARSISAPISSRSRPRATMS